MNKSQIKWVLKIIIILLIGKFLLSTCSGSREGKVEPPKIYEGVKYTKTVGDYPTVPHLVSRSV